MQAFPPTLTSLLFGITVITLEQSSSLMGVACTLGSFEPTPYHALNRSVLFQALPESTADYPIPKVFSRTPPSTLQ